MNRLLFSAVLGCLVAQFPLQLAAQASDKPVEPLVHLNPVPINPGEAVLATFLEENLYKPEQWNIHDGSAWGLTMQREYRMFHGAMFQWLRPPVGDEPAFCMEHGFDADVSGFDKLVVGAVLPDGARLTVTALTDKGKLEQTFDKLPDNRREYMLPLGGARRLKHLMLSVHSDRKGVQAGAVLWIILQNEQKVADYRRSLLPYGKEWEGHIRPADYNPEFMPAYGIVFAKDEMDDIRRRHEQLVEAEGTSPFLETAHRLMELEPEDLIKESPGNNIRFARDRDLDITELRPSDLAIAGILTEDKEMLRKAARYAMTLAVMPYWDEGFMAHFPGSSWMHAAFRESWTAHELAVTLDLAGEMFTSAGRDFILKRLAIDGVGHINYVTWKSEYIHRMNQMAVFSHGRVLSYAILEKTMPRVKPYLDMAYQDLVNSLQIAVNADGSDVEGPGYMTYTMAEAGLALHYYARARGKSLAEVVPSHMLRTADYAEAFCSTVAENDVIPVCDATPQIERVDALSFLAAITPGSRWADLYRKAMVRRKYTGRTLVEKQPWGILSLVVPRPEGSEAPAVKPFVSLSDMGVMTSTRKVGDEWLKILVQGNKAKAGHTHEDKGSFVIEFAGDVFAGDFGTAMYGDAMTFAVKQCQWHNMLVPQVADGERPAPANPVVTDVKPTGEGDERSFHASIDVASPWEKYYAKNVRTWHSSRPEELVITDDYELKRGDGVDFYWQTMLPVRRKGNTLVIEGRRGTAEVRIPRGATCRVEPCTWWTGAKVNRIILSKKGCSGKMETKVTFKLKKL